MSMESPRPPQEAEQENTAEMMAPTTHQVPASLTPTGEAGARRKLGKSGPSARKGRTVAKRKPEKKRPAPAKKAARKNTRATSKTFREKTGWRTGEKVGGRKPSAEQKKGPTKKTGPARKTVAKRTAAKTATAARRAPAAKRAPAAAKRTAKRATGRR